MKKIFVLLIVSVFLVGCTPLKNMIQFETNLPVRGNVVNMANETQHPMVLFVNSMPKIKVDPGNPPGNWKTGFIGGGGFGGYEREAMIMIMDVVTGKIFQKKVYFSGQYSRSFGFTVKATTRNGLDVVVD